MRKPSSLDFSAIRHQITKERLKEMGVQEKLKQKTFGSENI